MEEQYEILHPGMVANIATHLLGGEEEILTLPAAYLGHCIGAWSVPVEQIPNRLLGELVPVNNGYWRTSGGHAITDLSQLSSGPKRNQFAEEVKRAFLTAIRTELASRPSAQPEPPSI